VIGPEHRPDYLDALERMQTVGDAGPYEALMAGRLDASLSGYLRAVEEEVGARGSPVGDP
jgi:hypothetical protein